MLLTPADILGIANETDPTRGAADVGYSGNTVAYFLNEIANGTATLALTLTGMETVPVSLGMGLLQTTTVDIAQLAVNIKNSEVTVPIVATSTTLTFTQYNVGIIKFTGTLMANSTVTLPAISGIWIFANDTTGAYTLTLETMAMGATVLVEQGTPILAYSDGVNVYAVASGGGGGATTLTTYNYTATAGQTQIDVNYVPGNIVVSRLGAVLPTSDYMATTGVYVAFNTPLNAGDEISILVFGGFSAVGAISSYALIATAGQTTFSAGYTPGAVEVFQNGVLLMPSDYTATDGKTVVLNTGAMLGDNIQIISQNTTSIANTVPIIGGTFSGPVMVNGTITSTSGGFVFPDATTQGSAAMGKNRIINGACNVAQRPSFAYTFGVMGYGGPDRFYAVNASSAANGQFTQSQGTIAYGGLTLNAVVQTVNTPIVTDATTSYWSGITQKIEGFNCYDLLGSPVALSFIFNTNVNGTYSVSLQDYTQTNSWVMTFMATANTPMKVVIPISMLPLTLTTPNTNAGGLWLWVGALNTGTFETSNLGMWQTGNFISASTATNWGTTAGNYIALTQLQLERGALATPFEQRQYTTEFALCQCYYETGYYYWNGYGLTGEYVGGSAYFRTTKRTIPTSTATAYGTLNNASTTIFINTTSVDQVYLYDAVTATGAAAWQATWTASAEL